MPIEGGYEQKVDEALREWQQGDVILGERLPFLLLADLAKPLSPTTRREASSGVADGEDLSSVAVEVPGFVVVSQTCDILKPCVERPFVQLAGLQIAKGNLADEVRKGMRPGFAIVPALVDRKLVANLDLLMTIEKSVLTSFSKRSVIRGVRNDAEALAFSECLTRKFARFAFPEGFVKAVGPIQKRVRDKHAKETDEGRAYSEFREIRVTAEPGWELPDPKIEFLFILNEGGSTSETLDTLIEDLMKRFIPTGSFKEPLYRIVSLEDMTAALYVSSVPLDLDYLSTSTK